MPVAVILVVDDHESGRFAKAGMLRRAGFEVMEASTGRDALRIVEEVNLDALLLDVNLPDISGLEVSRRVRAGSADTNTLPILQISSTAVSSAEQVKGLEFGADVYVTEPIDRDVLVATIRALVRARRAEREVAQALQRERIARRLAEEANATKNDFIATLSHELRTPLNSLLGSVWQLRHAASDEAARRRALDRIERSAAAQARLINDLLDLSRIAKGKLTLTLRTADVATLLYDSVDAVRPAAQQKGVTLDVSVQGAMVIADPDRLQQVFVNLLSNAVQFTPAGGTITVESHVEAAYACVRVTDSGVGIAADFLPLVFDQFRQGEGSMIRKHGGLGLGLAVVKQLIDLHGGDVSASSEGVDQGASFEVRLPAEPPGLPVGTPALAGVHTCLVADGLPADVRSILAAAGADVTEVDAEAGVHACVAAGGIDVVVRRAGAPASPLTGASPMPHVVSVAPDDSPAAVVRRASRAVRRTSA
ncbi:MAG: ATP-binding protein [Vicinamibacterales bacterium]